MEISTRANCISLHNPNIQIHLKKGSKNYEEYCRCLLLQDKPGCTFDNVGKTFDSCEEELKDFVENSQFCPNLVKEEFKESQTEGSDQGKDPFFAGDPLYTEGEANPERAPKDDFMHLHDLGEDYCPQYDNEEFNELDPSYSEVIARNQVVNLVDWQEDRKKLGLTEEDIGKAPHVIDEMKRMNPNIRKDFARNQVNTLLKEDLNFKQRISYDAIED